VHDWSQLVDLAARRLGGMVMAANDEFFAPKERLLEPAPPVFEPGRYTDRGKWMDGWETRRRRGPGCDWAVVRLGVPGVVRGVVVDTTHFRGNFPEAFSLDGLAAEGGPGVGDPIGPGAGDPAGPEAGWIPLVPRTGLEGDAEQRFTVDAPVRVTHVRLVIHPDGGVARLRVHGRVTDEGWRGWGARWLDLLPAGQAEAELLACCASRAWARRLAAGRPYGGFPALVAAADAVWAGLDPQDWLEAFTAHPRIGERRPAGDPRRWSAGEQAGAAGADAVVLDALAEGNRAYEQRFGRVFLICATGRSAAEMLADLRRRLGNDPETELRVAAEEQRKITRLRLDKLVRP
jgi:allantoicase